MDKAFDGDRESYEVFEECIDGICESIITCGRMMPIPPSSLLRFGNDHQDADGQEHSGRNGISSYAYTGNSDGMGGDAAANKSPVSLNKGLENGIGLDTDKQIDPSLNLFRVEGELPWNGQPDIQLEVFDGDVEGVYIEYRYDQENGVEDEEDEYADIRVTNEDHDAYREKNGIEEVYDPRRPGIPINTIAIGRTDIPGLEGIDFVGRSSQVRIAMGEPKLDDDPIYKNRTIKSPYDPSKRGQARYARHAEEDLIAHFEKEVKDHGLEPTQIKGTLYIHQSNFNGVCNKCTVGLFSESDKKGIFKQFTEQYPNVNFVVTSDTRYGNATGYDSLTFNVINGEISNWTRK